MEYINVYKPHLLFGNLLFGNLYTDLLCSSWGRAQAFELSL